MQNVNKMNVSGVYYVMAYNKIQLLQAGPSPCTGNYLLIEYSGTIVEQVFCFIAGIVYNASFNARVISCVINGLLEGDYSVYIIDTSIQISSNSLSFMRRINSFKAQFELSPSNDVMINLTSSLSIPKLYCR